MIDIAIVEDNREQAAALEGHIKAYAADHKLSVSVSIFYEPITFLEKYSPFHIVYMDIMMPLLNGMDAAKLLREKDEKVILIFVTTMRQYAIQGYEVAASDFIVKPISYPEFALKFTKVLTRLEYVMPPDVLVRTDTSFVRLSPRDIRYVEVKGHHCVYHTTSGEYRQYQTMKSAESALAGQDFVRCNSFLLVNLAHVGRIDGMNVIVGGEPLQISHPKRKAFTDAFVRFMETQRYE